MINKQLWEQSKINNPVYAQDVVAKATMVLQDYAYKQQKKFENLTEQEIIKISNTKSLLLRVLYNAGIIAGPSNNIYSDLSYIVQHPVTK